MNIVKSLINLLILSLLIMTSSCTDEKILEFQEEEKTIEFPLKSGQISKPLNVLVTYNFPENATPWEKEDIRVYYRRKVNTLFYKIESYTRPNLGCEDNIEKWVVDEAEYYNFTLNNETPKTTGRTNAEVDDEPGCAPPHEGHTGSCSLFYEVNITLKNCFTDNMPTMYIDTSTSR